MPILAPTRATLPCLLLSIAACQTIEDKKNMVTAALDSASVSEAISTSLLTESGGSTDGDTTLDPTTTTTGDPTSTTSTSTTTNSTTSTTSTSSTSTTEWDPTATTGAPATCEAPEDCTGEGEGDLTSFVLPFFRGEVCVSDTFRPGDMMALSINPCVHPCLAAKKYAWRYIIRCPMGMGCEMAFMLYYRETTGSNCPTDVFGKFNPEKCVYLGPHKALTNELPSFGFGADKVVFPFLTNEDAAAVYAGEMNAEVWARIDGHAQGADRYFPVDVSDQNPAPPMECGPGLPGCTCKEVGF